MTYSTEEKDYIFDTLDKRMEAVSGLSETFTELKKSFDQAEVNDKKEDIDWAYDTISAMNYVVFYMHKDIEALYADPNYSYRSNKIYDQIYDCWRATKKLALQLKDWLSKNKTDKQHIGYSDDDFRTINMIKNMIRKDYDLDVLPDFKLENALKKY